MSIQNLIIYKFTPLYHILEELSLDLNFKIIYLDSENLLYEKIKNSNNYLIISNKKNLNFSNHIYLDNKPMNISKLVEKSIAATRKSEDKPILNSVRSKVIINLFISLK